jgi:hypothetical protein
VVGSSSDPRNEVCRDPPFESASCASFQPLFSLFQLFQRLVSPTDAEIDGGGADMENRRKEFARLLVWHLERGTNPSGKPDLPVEKRGPWSDRQFAEAIIGTGTDGGSTIRRSVSHWRKGRSLPEKNLPTIQRIFFGMPPDPAYDRLRQDFQDAYLRARDEGKGRGVYHDMDTRLQFGLPIPTLGDLNKVYDFDLDAYGAVGSIGRDLFKEWWLAYPEGFLCAYDGAEPVAVTGLFPVTEAWARSFVRRQVSEHDLRTPVIAASAGHCWYFSGISSSTNLQGLHSVLPCIIGFTLLRWLENDYDLPKDQRLQVVAEAASPEGKHLLHKYFGFQLASPAISEDQAARYRKQITMREIESVVLKSPFLMRCRELARRLGK